MSQPPILSDPTAAPDIFQPPVRRRSATLINVLLGLAVAVAIGGAAFAIGRATAPATARGAFPDGFPGGAQPNGSPGPGAFGGLGGARGGVSIEGSVVSVDADSMTIKTAADTTIEVALDGTTAYHEQADATASAVTTGSDVIVRLTGVAPGGQAAAASGAPTGTASDVTVVP
jgi:hypothetical protein